MLKRFFYKLETVEPARRIRQRAPNGRRLKQDNIEIIQYRVELTAQESSRLTFLASRSSAASISVELGQEFPLRRNFDQIAPDFRRLTDQPTMRRRARFVQIDPKSGTDVPLLSEIDRKCTVACSGKTDRKIQGDRGLAALGPSHR